MADPTRLFDELLQVDSGVERILMGYNTNVQMFNENWRLCLTHREQSFAVDNNVTNVMYDIYHTFRGYNETIKQGLDILQQTRNATSHPRGRYEVSYTLFPTIVPNNESDNMTENLTPQEIEAATESFIFSEDMEPHTCPISLESIQPGEEVKRIRHCGHKFKSNHLLHWFQRSTCCPVCRYNLKQPDETSTSEPQIRPIPRVSNAFVGNTLLSETNNLVRDSSAGRMPGFSSVNNRNNTSFSQSDNMESIEQLLGQQLRTLLFPNHIR